MKTRMLSLFLVAGLAIVLAACVADGTEPPTPSPTPFGNYSQTLTDVPYCTMDGLPQKLDIYFPQSGGPWPVFLYVHGGG